MASMDISESDFQTPAGRKRNASDSPSPPPASQPSMPPSSHKNRTPLIATGIDPKFNTQIRQYHPNLRVFRIKQLQNVWIFIGDTPKDFFILQSGSKMHQVFGKNVNVSLPRSYQSAEATKGKILVSKGVSSNVTLDDFKELLDYNKITHAEAERVKSKRSGRNLPFIKIKCDNIKQGDALISGD